jgi:hypothetical protein
MMCRSYIKKKNYFQANRKKERVPSGTSSEDFFFERIKLASDFFSSGCFFDVGQVENFISILCFSRKKKHTNQS